MLEPLDVNREKLIPLATVVERLHVAYTTVWRWIHVGNDGIYLAARKIGGRWFTSEEALQRYCDAATTASLGERRRADDGDGDPAATRSPTIRQMSNQAAERQRQANRSLRMCGLDGDGSVFEKTTASKELACDLHEFLEGWLPGDRGVVSVRSGIFRHAVEIMEGKHGKSRSFAAAKAWVESLDLKTFNVRSLYGVGPLSEVIWMALLRDPQFVARLPRPKSTEPDGAAVIKQTAREQKEPQ